MNSLDIYLARHGETEYNRLYKLQGRGIDAKLNDTGIEQARAAARYLEPVKLENIYSSSLKRSRETAVLIAETKNMDVESYAELDEMGFGVLEGREVDKIKPELDHLHEAWRSGDCGYGIQGGESPAQVLQRAQKKMLELIGNGQHKNLLFVLHGRLIRILLSNWLEDGLQNMHKIKHSNGAIYHLKWDGKKIKGMLLNYTDHLRDIDCLV